MALRNIVYEGEDLLRKKSREVKEINERIKILLDDMWETMDEENGVGLAAPQVGVLRRVVVIDTGGEGEKVELINPKIIKAEGSCVDREGCLSIPGFVGEVERPEKVVVEALNRDGKKVVIEGEGIFATALCHELDHLDGILFIDKATDIVELDLIEDEEVELDLIEEQELKEG